MISVQLLALGLVLVSCVAAGKNDIDYSQIQPDMQHVFSVDDYPHVKAVVQGVTFTAPFFDKTTQPSPPEVKDFATDALADIMVNIKDIIRSSLVLGERVKLLWHLGKTGVKLYFQSGSFIKRSNELDKKYNRPKNGELLKQSVGMLPELLAAANKQKEQDAREKKNFSNKKMQKQVGERMLLLMDGIYQLVANSPVEIWLKFKEIQVDGKSMFDELVEHIKYMRKANLDFVINKAAEICANIQKDIDRNLALEANQARP